MPLASFPVKPLTPNRAEFKPSTPNRSEFSQSNSTRSEYRKPPPNRAEFRPLTPSREFKPPTPSRTESRPPTPTREFRPPTPSRTESRTESRPSTPSRSEFNPPTPSRREFIPSSPRTASRTEDRIPTPSRSEFRLPSPNRPDFGVPSPTRATEYKLPPVQAKREHRGARIYEPKSPVIAKPEAARTQERPAPILALPGLPPSSFSLPDEVSKKDVRKKGLAGKMLKSGKTWLAQLKPPWAKEEDSDPLTPKIPPTPKTADWAIEEGYITPKATPKADFGTSFAKTFGISFTHARKPSDQSEEWNRDPPPLYKKHAPEGTIQSWSTLASAFLIQFCTIGFLFTWNVFEDHYTHHFLTDQNPIAIRFIGSVQWFLAFFLALVGGKLADCGFYKFVVLGGSVLFTVSLFILSFAPEEAIGLVFVAQAIGMGISIGLVFVPTATVATRYFTRMRGFAIGIAMSGGSLGSVIFPPVLRALIPTLGLPNAVRVVAALILVFLIAANAQIWYFPLPEEEKSPYPLPRLDIAKYTKELEYLLLAGGTFIAMLFIFYPAWYLQLAGLTHGVDVNAAFSSVIVLSLFGVIGRVGLGFASDKVGVWNLLMPTSFFLAIMMFSVATVSNVGTLIVVSMFYGIFSSAWLSLIVTVLASFASRTSEVGTRVGLILSIASFGQLFSDLIQNGTLGPKFSWAIPSAIAGVLFLGITAMLVFCRMMKAKNLPLSKRKFIAGIKELLIV